MRMAHVYQPVMLRELLDRGGRASRKDHRGVDLIFDVLPLGRLGYGRCEPPLLNLVVSPTTTVEQL
jgi:uncharacterized heparinase superfamily protein